MRPIVFPGLAILVTACQTLSPDGGMDAVADFAGRRLHQHVAVLRNPEDALAAHGRVAALLRKPLTANAAVQIALLNNRDLQAAYDALGLAEASMIESSLPPNPSFSLQHLAGPVEIEIERRIVANILALATLPARSKIAADRFRQAQLRAIAQTLRLAAETRRAYYRAVAAAEMVALLDQAKAAADTAAQLARRLGETGAMNKLDQAREQVFYAEVTAQLAIARQRAGSEREHLVRLLGLWGSDLGFRLPASLPPLPRKVRCRPTIEADAVRRRVDLEIARIELAALARSYGLKQATRFVNLLAVSGVSKTTRERAIGETIRDRGVEVEFQIPLFDFGEMRVRQAELTYRQAVNRLIATAVNVRSEAREAYRNYRSAYDIALHYQREVLPLHKIIADEMLLRYNAMQIDVFALLAETRERIRASIAAIEARRAFWLAAVALEVAVVGGDAPAADTEVAEAVLTAAEGGAGGH